MQYATDAVNPTPTVQPFNVSITLETADDVRWFYHLMNFQLKEIMNAYDGASKGDFDDRFQGFDVPDKKALFKAIKQHAADNNVTL